MILLLKFVLLLRLVDGEESDTSSSLRGINGLSIYKERLDVSNGNDKGLEVDDDDDDEDDEDDQHVH